VKKPRGRYVQPEGNDCFDKVELGGDITFTETRQSDSTHMLLCPICGDRYYTDRRYMERIVLAQTFLATLPPNSIEILGPACEPCHAVMGVNVLPQDWKGHC